MWLIGAVVCVCAAPRVQLFVSKGNGWLRDALRYRWLLPISCHFQDCEALLVTSLTRVSSPIASTQPLPLPLLSAIQSESPIGSPYIVTIWKVVFTNKSEKLGWIWMKLGRWGWGLKRLSLARLQRNRAMGFGVSAKKWVADPLFFCDVYDAPLLPLSLDRFPPNFAWTPAQVASHDRWFHIPEKFTLRGWISRKAVFFYGTKSYPVCAQAMGHGKRSAMPRLSLSPGGHPTDVPYLGDFCWGMYRFPAVHVRSYRKAQYRYESKSYSSTCNAYHTRS